MELVSLLSCAATEPLTRNDAVHKIHDVPFYPQRDSQCGPAALASVMNFWGVHVTPGEIAREIFSKSARGTLNIDMLLYAQRKGLYAECLKGDMRKLKKLIDSGYPVIVLVDNGFALYQVNHFMVVTGYNGDGVIVNSGSDRDKFISERDFLRTWKKTDFWTLLMRRAAR